MARIKLNLSRLAVPEKIAKARQIVEALTGNTSFPTPNPALPAVTTAITDINSAFEAAQAARQSAKEKTSALNEKEDALDRLLTQLAGYVESVAGSNDQLVLAAGMDVKARPVAPTEKPAGPLSLNITAGDADGEIDLFWEPVASAKSYQIERSTDPNGAAGWTHAGATTKAKATMNGLTSGTRYWFRVAAVGTAGQGGWSDPASKIAP
jgi:hypothetical protein